MKKICFFCFRRVALFYNCYIDVDCSLKTNWLKWNADYDNAAHSFDKAGNGEDLIYYLQLTCMPLINIYIIIIMAVLHYRFSSVLERSGGERTSS